MEKSIFSAEYKIFLKLLKTERSSRGASQADIGARLGKTQSFVSKCERGERRLDFVEVHRICEVLGISLSAFAKKYETSIRKGRRHD